jgi:hypothetical protein
MSSHEHTLTSSGAVLTDPPSTCSYGFSPVSVFAGGETWSTQVASAATYPSVTAHAASTSSFLQCDDRGVISHYMQQFPPLQPTRVMVSEPAAHSDTMVYPENPPHASAHSARLQMDIDAAVRCEPPLPRPIADVPIPGGFYLSSGESSGPYMPPPPREDVPPSYQSQAPLTEQPSVAAMDPTGPQQVQRNASNSRRGPFKNQDMREKTAQTRKIGSCVRCRMQRIRVSHPP